VRKTEIPKMGMRIGATTGTASATKNQTMNLTASLWRTMKGSQVQKFITVS
jgi:hypothetical protein